MPATNANPRAQGNTWPATIDCSVTAKQRAVNMNPTGSPTIAKIKNRIGEKLKLGS
jgi:hypothetical protein